MPVLFMDSAAGGDGEDKWDTFQPASVQSSGSVTDRPFYRVLDSPGDGWSKDIPATDSALVGWWGRVSGSPDNDASIRTFEIFNEASVEQVLTFPSGGAVRVRMGNGSGPEIATSAAGVIQANEWHHFQYRTVLDDTEGELQIWVDGVLVLDFVGATCDSGSPDVTGVRWGNTNSFEISWDGSDFFMAATDTPFGVSHVAFSLPDADGDNTDLTASETGDNYEMVNENPPDGDATYVFGDTEGDFDLYEMDNLPAGNFSVLAVQSVIHARKAGTGDRSMRPVLRVGSSNYTGEDVGLDDDYEAHIQIFQDSPDTSEPWTPAEVNALEVGLEVRNA